jgi:threonine dehydrogenase-like Zn-dependent dehydrogenase
VKAFYITEPGSTAIGELQQPRPEVDEVLLKTRLIGMCGTDLSAFRGKNPLVSYPRIPGHEIAATIVEVGSSVPAEYQPGTNVTVYPNTHCGKCASCKRGRTNACKFNETLGVQRDGAMKSFFTAPWQKVYRADGLSLEELSVVEPLAVGFHAAERGRVTAADVVAVIGCGMVGLGAMAAATARRATVIAIDLDDAKLSLAKLAGARHTVHSGKQSLHDVLGELTDGLGPDVVIEAVGVPDTYRMAVEEVAHTGRVVYVGWAKEPVSYETKLFVHKELDVLGSRNSLAEFPAVIEMLAKRDFPVAATISARVPIEGAGGMLRKWSESPQAYSKILVEMDA